MLKKFLILPILGLVGLTSLSYADTVDGFTSESDIKSVIISNTNVNYDYPPLDNMSSVEYIYACISSSDLPFVLTYGGQWFSSVNSSVYCYPDPIMYEDAGFFFLNSMPADEEDWYDENNLKDISGKLYTSISPITYSSSSDSSDSSTVFPSIPGSFTSGITALVSNFGSTIVGRLPTIILVALGIYAIFALFRVVRNYARSTFNG